MMRRGMAQDFSWERPAHEYVRVYERVIRTAASASFKEIVEGY